MIIQLATELAHIRKRDPEYQKQMLKVTSSQHLLPLSTKQYGPRGRYTDLLHRNLISVGWKTNGKWNSEQQGAVETTWAKQRDGSWSRDGTPWWYTYTITHKRQNIVSVPTS